jgi:FtsH-binding integral membrane protein
MAKKKKSAIGRWFSNNRLISLEAILLVGLVESLVEGYVMALDMHYALKILFVMLFIAGAFGVLMSVVVLLTKRSLSQGHKVLQGAVSHLVIHALVLGGIYWLYYSFY